MGPGPNKKKRKNWDNFLPKGRPCGRAFFNFPEKTSVFPAPLGLVTSAQRVPAQTKKKEKIGTIFWEQTFRFVTPKGPKGGLAVGHVLISIAVKHFNFHCGGSFFNFSCGGAIVLF
jgi:hypothetical protein